MKPYKNRPKIIKGNNGIKTDDTVATFGLPEVNVYPNNRWGDIARNQGLETARNWRKVKEGTTKGINDFGKTITNSTQTIGSFFPVISDIQDTKDFYESYKNKDYTGMFLATAGFFPYIGGFASNANKVRKFSKNWNLLSDREWDDLYNKALKENDIDMLSLLRKEHFKSKTPNNKIIDQKVYRGDNNRYNSFIESHVDDEVGEMNGIYTTFDKKYASEYGNFLSEMFMYSKNPYYTTGNWTGIINNKTKDKIINNNYDAIINSDFDKNSKFLNWLKGGKRTENVVFSNNQLKSANPITYDDFGEIIPLSKRDNFANSDIRYSIIPTTLLGGTYLYNKSNNE